MKKTLTALALIATASASNAHQYNQGGFEIDSFYISELVGLHTLN